MLGFYLSMLGDEGEREEFEVFYRKHQGRCLRVALAITRNQAWAEEAVHEAFLRMIRQKEKYFSDPRKRTGTLIVIMVKGAAINILHRERRLEHALLENAEPVMDNNEPDAYRVTVGKEALSRLEYHVSQLDEISQTLYEMKYILGKSDGEIAETVGLSKNAVAIRLHRLTKMLRDTMRKDGYIDE